MAFQKTKSSEIQEDGDCGPYRRNEILELYMNTLKNGIIDEIVHGDKEVYNSVFFFGDPVSVRLTMNKLAKAYGQEYPQDLICRTNGIDFVCELLGAIKEGTVDRFKEMYRHARLLIFENVEVIAGRETTMQMFYNIFDDIYESGGRIVIGGSKPPAQIQTLEDRVRTQLEGGIICCVDD